MSIFSKLFSIFRKPTTNNEIIIQNALEEKIPAIMIDKPRVDKIVVTQEDVKNLTKNPYTFDFTEEKFRKILVNSEEKLWFDAMYNILPSYGINTPERVAGFLAQTCHESQDYNVLEENLHYSASGLRKTFHRYFGSIATAGKYAKKPKMIANLVYSNRMGNGNVASGDGYKFRGRGPIQITGKYNYINCSKYLFNDSRLVEKPDLILLDKEICIMSACWYWSIKNINRSCDKKDILTMTKLINGGTNGIADRRVRFNKYLTILR